MKLGTLMYQVKKMIKKVIKSGGHRLRFDVTMLTNTAILDPLTKTAQTKRRDFFDDACGIAQNLTLMYCLSTYIPEKCLLMPLFLLYVPKYN